MLVEAQGGTTRRIVSIDFYKNYHVLITSSPKPWEDVEQIALEDVGEAKYGFLEAIYVGMRDFFWHAFKLRLPQRQFPNEICSEFVARVYDIHPHQLSPKGLWDALNKRSL